jgi:hypothetical protein
MSQTRPVYFDRDGVPIDLETIRRLRADETYRIVTRERIVDSISVCTSWLRNGAG